MMHSRWINGNIAYWDTHMKRIINGWGPTVCKFIEDWQKVSTNGTNTIDGYTVTLVAAGVGNTLVPQDEVGGGFIITTPATDTDGFNIQAVGESFALAAGKPCYFGTKLKIGDATQTQLLVGLCNTSTDALAAVDDGVYFVKVDGSTALNFVLENTTTETATAAHTMTTGYVTLEWYFDGSSVDFFIDGVKGIRGVQTNRPTAELRPTLHFLTGEGNVNVCTVKWIRAIQFG
jgi:hypothetical protein